MGYAIYIGDAVLDESKREEYEYTQAEWDALPESERLSVAEAENESAPHFMGDSLTGQSNNRHPTYSGWLDFCRATGLHDLFFDKRRGLMREHPGLAFLTPAHLKTVRSALAAYRAGPAAGLTPMFDGPDAAAHLARLVWLEFWMDWALRTCARPAIANR